MHIPDQFCTPVCDKTVSDALVDLAYDIHFSLEQQVIDLIDASLYRVFHGYYNILYFVILSSVKYILKGLEWQRCGVGGNTAESPFHHKLLAHLERQPSVP